MTGTESFVLFLVLLSIFGVCWFLVARGNRRKEAEHVATLSPEAAKSYYAQKQQREEEGAETALWGQRNAALVCPHCATRGNVRTKPIQRKAGLSGGKATAAILTGGVSMLATGLSRKEAVTQAHCTNCGSTWHF